jgi:hypothetical protein
MVSSEAFDNDFKLGYFLINILKNGITVFTWVCCNMISEIHTLYGVIFFLHGRASLPLLLYHAVIFDEKED